MTSEADDDYTCDYLREFSYNCFTQGEWDRRELVLEFELSYAELQRENAIAQSVGRVRRAEHRLDCALDAISSFEEIKDDNSEWFDYSCPHCGEAIAPELLPPPRVVRITDSVSISRNVRRRIF